MQIRSEVEEGPWKRAAAGVILGRRAVNGDNGGGNELVTGVSQAGRRASGDKVRRVCCCEETASRMSDAVGRVGCARAGPTGGFKVANEAGSPVRGCGGDGVVAVQMFCIHHNTADYCSDRESHARRNERQAAFSTRARQQFCSPSGLPMRIAVLHNDQSSQLAVH